MSLNFLKVGKGTASVGRGEFGLLTSPLDFPLDLASSSFPEGNGPFASFQAKRIRRNHQVFWLVFFLLFSLARLCALCWPHHDPAQSRAAAKLRSRLPRLLKPRTPADCPACRLASPASSAGGPAPLPVRPCYEVKSRRGAPKRVNTEGFACPNRKCLSFGITESQIHAASWRWQAWPC